MPCYDGRNGPDSGVDYSEFRRLERKLAMVEAILCGLIRASGGGPMYEHNLQTLFQKVDWEKAGVKPSEAYNWWTEHLAKDKARD